MVGGHWCALYLLFLDISFSTGPVFIGKKKAQCQPSLLPLLASEKWSLLVMKHDALLGNLGLVGRLAGFVCCSAVCTNFTEEMSRWKCPDGGQLFWFIWPPPTRAHLCFAWWLLCCYRGYACCNYDRQVCLMVWQALCRKERDARHGNVNPEVGNVWKRGHSHEYHRNLLQGSCPLSCYLVS